MSKAAAAPPVSLQQVEAFVSMIATRSRTDRVTADEDFLLMLWRMVRALEYRAIQNPETLTQVVALSQRLGEIANTVVAVNAARYHVDPHRAASMAECGRAMGISKQSASDRRALGLANILKRLGAAEVAAGVRNFSEARRERAAIAAASEFAVTSLAEYRARHAA